MSELETTQEEQIDGAPETPSELADLGWLVVNDTPEQLVITSETQGEARLVPRSIRAEKQINSTLVSVEASTPELLQTRIESLEETRAASPPNGPLVTPVSGRPVGPEQPAEALETVITPEGNFTEAEWSQRHRTDTIVTHDGQTFFVGVVEEAEETVPDEQMAALESAYAASEEVSIEAENERTAEEPLDSEQFTYDTAFAVDAPGISAGGTIVVPEGVSSVAEAQQAMNETSQAAENERVYAVEKAQLEAEEEQLQRETATTHGPTAQSQAEAEQARIDAIAGVRDEQEPAEQRSEAGLAEQDAAAQKAAAEADPSTPDTEAEQTPPATAAAVQAADELGVDLNEVEGTGTEGKITKADVEQHANG